jgi:hypothetical protein
MPLRTSWTVPSSKLGIDLELDEEVIVSTRRAGGDIAQFDAPAKVRPTTLISSESSNRILLPSLSPSLHSMGLADRFGSGQIQTSPNAPWIAFIAARYSLLTSFINFRRSTRRTRPPSPSNEALTALFDAVQQAYVRFSVALDRITVPHAVRPFSSLSISSMRADLVTLTVLV